MDDKTRQRGVTSPWFSALLNSSSDRSQDGINKAFLTLKERTEFQKYHPTILQQMCAFGHYDRLEPNILVIRQGDFGTNWYIVISGNLSVYPSEAKRKRAGSKALCQLDSGACFGESILTIKPHAMSIVTSCKVELLRLELNNFKMLWENYKDLMEMSILSLANLSNLTDDMKKLIPQRDQRLCERFPPAALPITIQPSDVMIHAAWVLRTMMLSHHMHMIRDRKYHHRTYKRCMVGTEMVDWLLSINPRIDSRIVIVGMWHTLIEEGVLFHVCKQHAFQDHYLFYRFTADDGEIGCGFPSDLEIEKAEEDLQEVLSYLYNASPDAILRCILRKAPEDRNHEDIEIIYEELLTLKPLSHLSCTVKRELASVVVFETHTKSDTVLFHQGDEGQSWYIILRGSVNVAIHGKGVVCVLTEGEDFGKLALVNDAPRAATIILREDNCHFLRVDKDDFNHILKDVEANTVRLQEHGQDVLVLEKIPVSDNVVGSFQSNYKYSVMAGTPEKMLEYLLETKFDKKSEQQTMDTFLDDFLLTHPLYFPEDKLCSAILDHYQFNAADVSSDQDANEFSITQHKAVIQFVLAWYSIYSDRFSSPVVKHFLETLIKLVARDCIAQPGLISDHEALMAIASSTKSSSSRGFLRRPSFLHRRGSTRGSISGETDGEKKNKLKSSDDNILKIYCADHTYTTIKISLNASVGDIVKTASDKLCLGHDPVLCEVKSNGERIVFQDKDRCVSLSLSINGRLFIAPKEHLDALTPLPEQEGPTSGTLSSLEIMGTKELAREMTVFHWELFSGFNQEELLVKVFKYPEITSFISANLDLFLHHFNEVQYWVVTEMVLANNVGKRVLLLKKFTKLAQHCKNLKNLQAFFAIMSGLSNIAVSRLSQTWEKLPNKTKKMFSEFECLSDPARNHRAYRMYVAQLSPPIIPFMSLVLKDMTSTHDGNKTYYDTLVNFEKMHMIGQTLRMVRFCKSQNLEIEPIEGNKSPIDIRYYIRNLNVIDNQRILTNLSHKCEPRKT